MLETGRITRKASITEKVFPPERIEPDELEEYNSIHQLAKTSHQLNKESIAQFNKAAHESNVDLNDPDLVSAAISDFERKFFTSQRPYKFPKQELDRINSNSLFKSVI